MPYVFILWFMQTIKFITNGLNGWFYFKPLSFSYFPVLCRIVFPSGSQSMTFDFPLSSLFIKTEHNQVWWLSALPALGG